MRQTIILPRHVSSGVILATIEHYPRLVTLSYPRLNLSLDVRRVIFEIDDDHIRGKIPTIVISAKYLKRGRRTLSLWLGLTFSLDCRSFSPVGAIADF
jgi:hypothetical protein